ncbi:MULTISPECIES: hypothetical protein [unclassified Microcoleus]|uniref:hypothetical protein n=1 Tax=unclassified Microcoleus TaxID=2642155 RepID=UPI0025FB57FD|nr:MULTISPECIES: hypothetical protein [unclassified Microcoleus]
MFVSRAGCFTIARHAFPGLPILLRRQYVCWTSLARAICSIVTGGSSTNLIVPKAVLEGRGFRPIFLITEISRNWRSATAKTPNLTQAEAALYT